MKVSILYVKNLLFYLVNMAKGVYIHNEYRPSNRANYGYIEGFDFKAGKIVLCVFDFGAGFVKTFDYDMLHF